MTDSFDSIYEQIIRCERRLEERQRLHTELRAGVENCKDTIKRDLEEQCRLQKELMEKVQQLSEAELNLTSLTAREDILVTQRETLKEENNVLKIELASVEEGLEEEVVAFCQSVADQSSVLDLSTSGQRARQSKAADTLTQLVQVEQDLVKDMAEYDKHKESIALLGVEKSCLQQSMCDMAHCIKELEECLAKEEEVLQQLEEKKQRVSSIPSCGDEFSRLRRELKAHNTDDLEQQCSRLQHQVHDLQQKLRCKQQQKGRVQTGGHKPEAHQQTPDAGYLENTKTVTSRPSVSHLTQQIPLEEPFEEDNDHDFTLPDLEAPMAEQHNDLHVCNRQKPVFKPVHC